MAALGLPVLPAFCVTSEWSDENARALVDRLWQDVLGGLELLEERTGRCWAGESTASEPTEHPDGALRRARDGDMSWLTRPMVDSYHMVWFELQEELLGLAGRTRASEAESGSAD